MRSLCAGEQTGLAALRASGPLPSSLSAPPCSSARSSMRAAAWGSKAMLDVILGAGVALFLLVYMTYALLWPEEL
jgi:hypothetical protein